MDSGTISIKLRSDEEWHANDGHGVRRHAAAASATNTPKARAWIMILLPATRLRLQPGTVQETLASAYTWTFTRKDEPGHQGRRPHNVALQNDGMYWSWEKIRTWAWAGTSASSCSDPIPAMVSIPASTVIKMIVTGEEHTLAVDADNKIYAWGQNFYGELGDGTATASMTPVLVSMLGARPASPSLLSPQAAITALPSQATGRFMRGGITWSGELGDGNETDSTHPVKVSGQTNVIAIVAGDDDQGSMGGLGAQERRHGPGLGMRSGL